MSFVASEESTGRHSRQAPPFTGSFARCECAVYGATCAEVGSFLETIRAASPGLHIGYVDASHAEEESYPGLEVTLHAGGVKSEWPSASGREEASWLLASADLVLVNGNHFAAERQVVLVNPGKESSLRKRADQLTHPVAVVLPQGVADVPAFVWDVLRRNDLPVFRMESGADRLALVHLLYRPPLVKALLLAGGKSTRMGADKAAMAFHRQPQLIHLAEELKASGLEVSVSCRRDQELPETGCRLVYDAFGDSGPLGGLLSAWKQEPGVAWLTLAVDMPGWSSKATESLLAHRDAGAVATAFRGQKGWAEPLAAIWEPRAYPLALRWMWSGNSCPRKLLASARTAVVDPSVPEWTANVNTPEEARPFLDSRHA